MKEIVLNELGYFSERECEAIKEEMQGKTYMNFDVDWSKQGINCTLIVKTDYEEDEQNKVKDFFISSCLRCIFQLKRGMQ